MPDLDIVEQRLAALGVDVNDIKEQDAYARCVILLDRCENRINNLVVKNREIKATIHDKVSDLIVNTQEYVSREFDWLHDEVMDVIDK